MLNKILLGKLKGRKNSGDLSMEGGRAKVKPCYYFNTTF
jgi:hypothetical protein